MSYDPLRVDAYAEHLSQVNDVQGVVAQEDIFNEQGALLVKQGQAITREVVDRIVKFKLVRPLEQSVNVSDSISATRLQEEISQRADKLGVLGCLEAPADYYQLIQRGCLAYQQYDVLVQKLTVLSVQLPDIYDKTIQVSWLAMHIASRLNMSLEDCQWLFIACIAHDLGNLHISPDILQKDDALTMEEWRAIQSHVVIGQKILQQAGHIPIAAATAVLEHHERCDGTGYPLGKTLEQLSLSGRIIAMADTIIAIYNKKLLSAGRGVRDLVPVLQMNSEKHGYDVYSATIAALRELPINEDICTAEENIPQLIDCLLEQNARLSVWYRLAEELIFGYCQEFEDKSMGNAKAVVQHLANAVRGSGVLDDGYLRWLQQVRNEQLTFAYREVEDVFLMLQEVRWQLEQFTRLMQSLCENNTFGQLAEKAQIDDSVEQMSKLVQTPFPGL